MSGHNKWSKIKRQKGVEDAKKGQIYTKLTREIIMAARQGGGDIETNFKLRLAVQKARSASMPKENIERAIERGAGGTEGAVLQELTLEGYGPSGTAILAQTLSDNRNRTVQEVRNVFTRQGGTMGSAGSVAWLFDSLGIISVDAQEIDVDDLTLKAIDAGAEDVKVEDSTVEIYTKPNELEMVKKGLEQNNINVENSELSMIPKTLVAVEEKAAIQTLKLLEKLEDLDDVQKVYSNVDFTDAVIEKFHSGDYD
ncbi:MAG: YebC/PmpR family DNA-binding transcriptional regulator [Dehalococcoidales bacterium]|nr:YebC/PmpR family DNA-binding transcriptional regulator [Dehalococcoidales bacterium]